MCNRKQYLKVDNAIHWINLFPMDNTNEVIHWIVTHLVDTAIQWITTEGRLIESRKSL